MNYEVIVKNIRTNEEIFRKEFRSFTEASSEKKNQMRNYRGIQYKFVIQPIMKEAYTNEDENK